MILIEERFLSADHIQQIYIRAFSDENEYVVIVEMLETRAIFSGSEDDSLTIEMAFELRRRIVKAIAEIWATVNFKLTLITSCFSCD